MSQIKTATRIGISICAFALMLTACGSSTENNKNVYNTTTGSHSADWKWAGHSAAAQADVSSCKDCHGQDLSGGISTVACGSCHMNVADMTGCISCHADPPSGSTAPNRAGAHAAHNVFSNVADACDTCHSGAGSGAPSHDNGVVDVAFLGDYNAKSGAVARNSDGTCSKVSCHGGQTTPGWYSGTSIDINTQCTSCHAYGTAEYDSFVSGQHQLHVYDEGIDCVACHDTSKLGVGSNHFKYLNTSEMEGPASATLISGLRYSGGSCARVCHVADSWW